MTLGEITQVPEGIQGTIITDCGDANAQARQQARFASLFGVKPTFTRLGESHPDLEASGHLVDVLDASRIPGAYTTNPSVVLVNVAPRGDDVREKWENGTPFCHFKVGEVSVVITFEGRALALARKLGLVSSVHLFDIPEVTSSLVDSGVLTPDQARQISNTQFRSLEFLPLAARELVAGRDLPSEEIELPPHDSVEGRAWFVDSFGNVKTTLLPDDVGFEEGLTVSLAGGQRVTAHTRLTDVPSGEFGLTIGSSGYGAKRWLEVVKQRGRAADATELDIRVGDKIKTA